MKKIQTIWILCSVGLPLLVMMSCTRTQTYEEVLAEELAKDVRYDSLFYGLHFNMTTPAFLEHCFEMNQQKIFFQDGVGSLIIIKFENEFKYPVEFKFFPNLEKNLIQELRGSFLYQGRNPFKKDRGSDVLIVDVVKQMEKWFGGRKFIKVPASEAWLPDTFVKIDGNRKITLVQNQVSGAVEVYFYDLKRIL